MRKIPRINLADISTEFITLRDGRRLAYARYGEKGGIPVYYFHGCPGSRLEAVTCEEWADAAGFEVFAFDRPGCGASSHAQGYRLLDWPTDIKNAASQLSHERFGIIGFSGGGAYIDACAYAIPERLLFAYNLGGWAPVASSQELQQHLAPLDRFFLKRASSFGPLYRIPFSLIGFSATHFNDRGFAKALKSSMGEDDRKLVFSNENVAHLFRGTVKESFAQGSRGPADDALRCYSDWGFNIGDIDYPVHIWHGTDDKFASFEFAKYKHKTMKLSLLKAFEGRGHLHLITVYQQLFTEILEQD